MDTENLISQSRARFEHATNKRLLKEKYQAKLNFGYNGGMFNAGPELLTVLLNCPDSEAVILDLYENPIKVNTKELYSQTQHRWQEQMTAWLVEYENSKTHR